MARIPVDVSRWPLLIARFPQEGVDEVDVLNFYGCWEEEMATRGRHASLIDVRQMSPLTVSPRIRRLAADQVTKRRAIFNEYLVAEARVVDNIVTRGVVTAFDWVASTQLSRPQRNLVSEPDAERWLLGELAKDDVTGAGRTLGGKLARGEGSFRQL